MSAISLLFNSAKPYTKGAQITSARSPWQLNFVWALSMKLASCHPSGV